MKTRFKEGRRLGGPLFFGVVLAFVLAGCAGGGGPGEPSPSSQAVARPLDIYRELGLVAGGEDYPVVASFATMAGPADSTYVLFALSMPTSALRFQREDNGFVGEYSVVLTFARDSLPVRRVSRQEVVRVRQFTETDRTDESVVFQELLALPPGEYTVDIEARDQLGSRSIQVQDSLVVPSYGAAGSRLAPPLFVYRVAGRDTQEDRPDLIVNPRHAVYYGTSSLQLYLEAYGVPENEAVDVRIVDRDGETRWQQRVAFAQGGASLRYALVDVPPASLPLGQLWVELVADGDTTAVHREPLLVTISDQWIVANFEEVLDFLAYIATQEELDSLREGGAAERRERWDAFWERRDPVPATPTNEFRERFFERIRAATIYFSEPGTPGWETDRGEVYIVLGPPENVVEQSRNREAVGRPNVIVWVYESTPGGRLELVFEDRHGFGRYELTPSSTVDFRSAAERLKRGR